MDLQLILYDLYMKLGYFVYDYKTVRRMEVIRKRTRTRLVVDAFNPSCLGGIGRIIPV
jgi:hypothetical protein